MFAKVFDVSGREYSDRQGHEKKRARMTASRQTFKK
jgi:hypothetical protein